MVVDRDRQERLEGRPLLDADLPLCAACGRALEGEPDEEPIRDAGKPIAGTARASATSSRWTSVGRASHVQCPSPRCPKHRPLGNALC
jgi:hypothetical protein